ncbi:apoptosis-associated speck-like protein containing a CARD [Gadus chalcogrammus]|uniref:apoptosis-associated speck-like protein containing a CARD n=1 Tax=Gadus chalcogrammus TaxID=1042646 RepID=UPI0024C47E6D|nr:apoptosis-associated speck-like protein containing a CARD [Gadus chalcogrammus]
MASTIRQVLQLSLEELTKDELKKFCARLLDRERVGEPRVRRRALEDKDEVVIADVLVSTFTGAKAGSVVVETLQAIQCNHIAARLEAELANLNPQGSRPSANSMIPTSKARPGEHFVDKHRSALIQRIRRFPPILDKLMDLKVLSQEEYDAIMAIPTSQEQARLLYNGALTSSGTAGKDIFLSVLEESEFHLLQDLRT